MIIINSKGSTGFQNHTQKYKTTQNAFKRNLPLNIQIKHCRTIFSLNTLILINTLSNNL